MALVEVRELGRGGFGRVYLARDEKRGIEVAVKELLDDEQIDRFSREVRVLLDHIDNRYVVSIYDYELKTKPAHIVMEFCEGGSLRQHVGKVPWRQTATMLLQAATGLLGLHSAGGFHRDLKPDNLLLGRNPEADGYIVKVADFGLARRPQTATPMTFNGAGTPGYIAPEIMQGKEFTTQADVYSLGIVGWELVTGHRGEPSSGKSLLDVDGAEVPAKLRLLLRRMASLFPWVRPAISDAIVALGEIVQADGALTSQSAKREPTTSVFDREWLMSVLALGGLFLATAALNAGDKRGWEARVRGDRSRLPPTKASLETAVGAGPTTPDPAKFEHSEPKGVPSAQAKSADLPSPAFGAEDRAPTSSADDDA